MPENTGKREAVAMGNISPQEAKRRHPNIDWKDTGVGAKCLGIPIGYKVVAADFWDKKIKDVRKVAQSWTGLIRASKEGRNMVVQSCYYGRMRYYIYSICPPKKWYLAWRKMRRTSSGRKTQT